MGDTFNASVPPANVYFNHARQLAARGERDQAIGVLQHLTALEPEFGFAWDDLGTLLNAAGKKEEALAAYEKAMKAAQRDPGVFKRYGPLALELGRLEEAARHYERFLSRAPNDLEALVGGASLRLRLGQFEQAENLLVRAAAVAPQNTEVTSFLETLRTSRAGSMHDGGGDATFPHAVTIIIPSYHGLHHIRRCLDSIYRVTPAEDHFEVVIVDNASNAETRAYLNGAAQSFPRLTLLCNGVNLGFARACNQGARAARGKHLLFLNNDTEVRDGWLRALLDVVESDPAVGAVGAKLLFPDGTVQHGGVIVVNNQQRDLPLQVTHLNLRGRADDPETDKPKVMQAVTGACLLVRRAAFAQAGGFDEGFWNGFEDVDLCFKMRDKGWLMVYEPRCVAVHYEMQGGPERVIRQWPNSFRLSDRWVGKIVPDVIVNAAGQWFLTNAGEIKPYRRLTEP